MGKFTLQFLWNSLKVGFYGTELLIMLKILQEYWEDTEKRKTLIKTA